MASTDHMLGHDQSDCFTCVDHILFSMLKT
jgi:hypothetical protein